MKAIVLVCLGLLLGMWLGARQPEPVEPVPQCPEGMVVKESPKVNGVVWVRCVKSSSE